MPYMMTLLESTGSGLSLDSVLSNAKTVFNWVFEIVTENTLLAIVFGLGVLIPVAVKGFKKLVKSAK